MRNMAFTHTIEQMRAGTKTVTRRAGWTWLAWGTTLCAVEKSMGLGKGGTVKRLGVIRVIGVRREPLDELLYPTYGAEEMVKEGFPGLDPREFIRRYFAWYTGPGRMITRIEFEHLP